jgi:hypothetical protein
MIIIICSVIHRHLFLGVTKFDIHEQVRPQVKSESTSQLILICMAMSPFPPPIESLSAAGILSARAKGSKIIIRRPPSFICETCNIKTLHKQGRFRFVYDTPPPFDLSICYPRRRHDSQSANRSLSTEFAKNVYFHPFTWKVESFLLFMSTPCLLVKTCWEASSFGDWYVQKLDTRLGRRLSGD